MALVDKGERGLWGVGQEHAQERPFPALHPIGHWDFVFRVGGGRKRADLF